jgi:diguanylate cyclase (GGDEF)-like protein
MKEDRKRIVMQWAFPTLILMAVLIGLVINFNVNSRANATKVVEKQLLAIADRYSVTLSNKLDSMANATRLASEALAQTSYGNNKSHPQAMRILRALQEYSPAVTVALIDASGVGVDNDGLSVNLSEKDYFSALLEGTALYVHVKESSINGTNAVVFKHAVEGTDDWLVAYYGLEDIRSSIGQSELGNDVLYVIVDRDGLIVASAHSRGSGYAGPYLKNANLYDALNDGTFREESNKMKRARGNTGTTGAVKIGLENENRSLAYTQFPVNRWQVVVGARESFVDGRERLEYSFSQATLRNIAIALGLFAVVMVGINMYTRVKHTAKTKELAEKADTDLLTGLNNKVATERKIQEYFTNNPTEQAIMFVLDIDNFKKINDTMGHAFGDEVLRSLGQQISPIFRASDVIGRIGGDEMIILLKNINNDEILLREATKVARFFHEFKAGEYVKYSATASIGAAIFPRDGKDFESMYKAADQALYMAKKRGKNQLAFYHDTFEGVVIKS